MFKVFYYIIIEWGIRNYTLERENFISIKAQLVIFVRGFRSSYFWIFALLFDYVILEQWNFMQV